jgi:hypothetical protein
LTVKKKKQHTGRTYDDEAAAIYKHLSPRYILKKKLVDLHLIHHPPPFQVQEGRKVFPPVCEEKMDRGELQPVNAKKGSASPTKIKKKQK